MNAYINYPNPHITIHRNSGCSQIRKNQKSNQRHIDVTPQNVDGVMKKFANDGYKFSASSEYNDLWLDISLGTTERDDKFLRNIRLELGRHYKPFEGVVVNQHCSDA